jgi:OOP family OmpA-OmpF porin
MGDVLFDTGKYDLRMNAQGILAGISGIVLAHAGLNLEVGRPYGRHKFRRTQQRLSRKRAAIVRDYLIAQGLDWETITARGFGRTYLLQVMTTPTDAGRTAA